MISFTLRSKLQRDSTHMLLYVRWKRTHSEHQLQNSPSFRKLCGLDLKSLVHHYFMSQSHVGDSFSRLHQLLHRDEPGWAGWEEKMWTFVHSYTSALRKLTFPLAEEVSTESFTECKASQSPKPQFHPHDVITEQI